MQQYPSGSGAAHHACTGHPHAQTLQSITYNNDFARRYLLSLHKELQDSAAAVSQQPESRGKCVVVHVCSAGGQAEQQSIHSVYWFHKQRQLAIECSQWICEKMTDPVTLNVGGHLYTTSLSTLQRYPDSMLGAMFGGDFPSARDAQGHYFIDRDGPLFRHVLNFLRTSELTLPTDFKETELLRKEADFYQIEPLIQCLRDPKPLYPLDTFEQVVELSSTRKLSKYSNPVAVIITQLTITTKVHALLEGIANSFTKWNKHMMDTRDCQVSFTFGPCDYHQEVSLRVHLMDYITKQGFTIRNTRVHHMSERANENTVEHHWTFCRLARKVED
ncbi:BTB/POZ domain-containing protein KCTD6 isoform X1 [Anguilla rostrata]